MTERHSRVFATLLGSLPRPPLPDDATPAELLVAVVRAQEDAGLELVSDAGFGIGATPTERWQRTAAASDRPVKQAILGPCSRGRGARAATLAAAEVVHRTILGLVDAGCPYIEVHEPWAVGIEHDTERALFREAHARLLEGVVGTHLCLVVTGGNADRAGIATLLSAPYASLAVDLIAGPDNWRLVVAAPGDLGIVCGALPAVGTADDRREVLLWAAGYAASTGGRGPARVGLASASSLAGQTWDVAVRKLTILGEAARLADLPAADRRQHLDPRAVDIRSAALGHVAPRPRFRRRSARRD